MNPLEVNEKIAIKVRDTVRHGLSKGLGMPEQGKMCIEAAVCFAYGLPHSDDPPCVGSSVRAAKIRLNDSDWPDNADRANGMIKIAIAQLGSVELNQIEFARRYVILTINRIISQIILPYSAEISLQCEQAITLKEAELAARAACAAAYAAHAAHAAAAVRAASATDAYAARAAAYAATAATYAATAADRDAAAHAATYAATYAARAAHNKHNYLQLSADIILEILIEMKSPGCKYLYLLDQPK